MINFFLSMWLFKGHNCYSFLGRHEFCLLKHDYRMTSLFWWLSSWIYHAISTLQVDKAIFQDRVIRFPIYTQEVICVGNVAVVIMKKITSEVNCQVTKK